MPDRLEVAWFDRWSSTLDHALDLLPEAETCPHELYRMLAQNETPAPKRTALVTGDDRPVAVVCLRMTGGSTWEPVTQWVVPGVVCPAVEGRLLPALAALEVDVVVAWWRMGEPPHHPSVGCLETTPVHRLRLSEREEYWRRSSQWKRVAQARRKCADLDVEVNAPGAAEWVIRRWEEKWRTASSEDPGLGDRILAAQYLERIGRHYTITLAGRERILAGSTNTCHGDTLTAGVLYRDDSVGARPTGVRLIDLAFEVAEDAGLSRMDLGGGHGYKQSWAPADGTRSKFVVASEDRRRRPIVRGTAGAGRRLLRRLGVGAVGRA